MPLAVGARLGIYEVTGALGAGGMGEVYRARDTRLGRDVALKVLPDAFAADPDRLARFEREAQVLASLNHPNIGAIYGFEGRALVLELVDGPTLADRIARGRLPLDEALAIARQIAGALEAAHERGIIHRDLKPANIKLTPGGTVKVLDFGLAKLNDPNALNGPNDPNAITMSPAMTSFGVILGTAAYMSPEQAKGREIDRRADIWAFGCILYEMLSGRPVFAGGSVSEIVSDVLKSEPDWTALPADVPPHVRRVLRRCLDKDASRRVRDIGDAALDLDDPSTVSGTEASARRPQTVAVAAGVIAVLAIGVAAFALWSTRSPVSPAPMKQFHIAAPEGADGVTDVALSPSGRELAMAAAIGDGGGIWIRPLESVTARRVGNPTGRPRRLFWSPDGQSLGFFEGGQLKVLNLASGQTRTLAAAPGGYGGAWGADDTILFAAGETGGLFRVSARGGAPAPLTTPDGVQADSHRWPQFLPDGRRFIFTGWSARRTSGNDRFTIYTASIDAAEPVMVTTAGSAAVYAPPGYLLFAYNVPPRLVSLPFDGTRVTGEAVTLAEDVDYDWVSGDIWLSASPDGTLAYQNDRYAFVRPTWFDRTGAARGTLGEVGTYYDPAVSRDGASVVLEKSDPDIRSGDVWSIDAATGDATRLTNDPAFDNAALFSPDRRDIAYSSDRDGVSAVFLMAASGGVARKLFGPAQTLAFATDWSPDGAYLLVTTSNAERNRDVWLVPTGPAGQPEPVFESPVVEHGAVFSPDGRWIAYSSDESGTVHVYVRPWPSLAQAIRVSVRDGAQPKWRADGRELFYVTSDGTIMAAAVTPGPGPLRMGAPQRLFSTPMNLLSGLRNSYAPAPDGQRFLVLSPIVERKASPVTAIVNWTALTR